MSKTTHRIGSMFSGYGGLCTLTAAPLLGMDVAWHCETDKFASKLLEVRAPGIPNLGDVTSVDWSNVQPVDVVAAGFPCTDISYAGKGAGIKEGTRSGLWSEVVEAVRHLGPRLVLLENVSAIVAKRPGLDVVLNDLARIGYDARWTTLRASAVGAPHQRNRWWCIAYPAHTDGIGQQWPGGTWERRGGPSDHHQPATDTPALLPTPRATDGTKGGPGQVNGRGVADSLPAIGALLPTPVVNDMGDDKTLEWWDSWTADMKAKHGNGNGHGRSLSIEAQRLLPAPKLLGTPDANQGVRSRRFRSAGENPAEFAENFQGSWGDYADAIIRWEQILGRLAPEPTAPGKTGKPQLSPNFVEWLMGLPDGWVTGVPGVSRNQQLKALGNGVVPAQATAAYRSLLAT